MQQGTRKVRGCHCPTVTPGSRMTRSGPDPLPSPRQRGGDERPVRGMYMTATTRTLLTDHDTRLARCAQESGPDPLPSPRRQRDDGRPVQQGTPRYATATTHT